MMSFMIVLASLLIVMLKHPLSMGITLVMTAISTSLITTKLTNSPWYPFIFFIIMVGGVLVLFLYMASISPNSMKQSFLILPIVMVSLGVSCTSGADLTNQMTFYSQTMKTMLSSSNSLMTPLMALYLLVTMILVIKITNKNKSPLRKV